MGFQFKNATCVAVGTFNIYIIQPAWLKEIGLIPEGVEGVMLETDLTQPGFRMKLPDITWRVAPTKISLETSDWAVDCGANLAVVMEKLPWTPLKAFGVNCHFEAPVSEVQSVLEKWSHPAMRSRIPDGCELKQTGWHVSVAKARQVYNLNVTVRGDVALAFANVHTDLSDQDADRAKDVAGSAFSLRDTAVELVSSILGVQVFHDPTVSD